ncbi:beta-eliminating lyase [Hypoxylon sp. FL1857]|nr:beta-eliminating lyase [Hypoxylon sp. FL1857]
MASFIPRINVPPPSHHSLVVRSLPTLSVKEREDILRDVEYNIFNFPAGLLTCDFLTDSGTSAMTDVQWAALMRGDDSYGRNWGYYCLLDAFRDIFERGSNRKRIFETVVMGMADVRFYRNEILVPFKGGFVNGGTHQLQRPNFFIVPQGRCAENLLFSSMRDMISQIPHKDPASIIVSNGLFDTTAANATVAGFELQTFTQPGLNDKFPSELIGKENFFKGNMDLAALESLLNKTSKVALIIVTITNNWAAAQPVSMANIRSVASLARRHGIPLFFDACRFAENAFFIHQYEKGFSNVPIAEIIQEMFSYADGFTMSLKKDGLANMGGVLCFHDERLFSKQFEGIGLMMKERQLLWYGNDAYGGMSGRDLIAATVGLYEATKLSYLQKRKIHANGVATLSPPGGHAIYLDMNEFFYGCEREPEDFASIGFTLELIKEYGIRALEAGPFVWEWDKKSPEERKKIPNLVRFALPRNVLSDEHIDYSVAAIKELYRRRHTIPNVIIMRGKEMRVRHFRAAMQPVFPGRPDRSYVDEAIRQLSDVSRAVGLDDEARKKLLDALTLAGGNWGQTTIPLKLNDSAWASNVSNGHSPVEYSLALAQQTGDAELSFLIEAQPEGNNLPQRQESSLQINEKISAEYGTSVSLDRFNLIRDIFMPPQAEGSLAAWHSFAVSNTRGKWKIYLNPLASGQSRAKSLNTTREAFERLGLASSWTLLESILSPNDYIIYFSLGLAPDLDNAEVKVYVAHPGASAAQIAQKHVAVCPEASAYEIQHFCASLSGGSLGPYTRKPLISCFAFKRSDLKKTARTVLFPIDSYSANDEEAQERIEKYMRDKCAPLLYRERYRKAISAIQRRPLAAGRGIHSWVSLKQNPDGALSNTYYLSPEFFGPLQDVFEIGSF